MKLYREIATGRYLSQTAHDRWLAGQDVPQKQMWTRDIDAAAMMCDDETPPAVDGCEIVKEEDAA